MKLTGQLGIKALPERLRWRRDRSRTARLTIVSQFFPPDFAATGQFVEDLSRRLSERGLQILVLSGQPGYAYQSDRAERIEFQHNRCIRRTSVSRFWPDRIRGRAVNSLLFCLRTALRLLRQARRGDLLLVTTEPAYLPVISWLIHLITRAPYIVLIYDLYPDIAVSLKVVSAHHPLVTLWAWLHRQSFASARELIVLSSTMREHVRKNYPSVHTPINVIPSWADPKKIQPINRNDNWFVQRHKLNHKFVVLYAGNQGRCHDLNTLIDAAEVLRGEANIQFLLVGSGAQNCILRSKAENAALTNITFLPFQDSETLPMMLASANLAVISLLAQAEGQVAPSKLYGHLAAGTPIAAICSQGSYLRHKVEIGGCGRCFSSGEHQQLAAWILALASDPQLCHQLGTSARAFLLQHATPDLAVQAYAELLARHLPLEEKTYAQPLNDAVLPLPIP
ncbi:MAG: glycosyltransferase family 4 protein [Cyanobium sp.]